MNTPVPQRIDRRRAVQWMLSAAASLTLLRHLNLSASAAEMARAPATKGYGTDPDLLKSYNPGDFWPLTMTERQRDNAAALCDTILPADATSPSASSLGVHDFIDEVVSSPYPDAPKVRATILNGLAWLEGECKRRFEAEFRDLNEDQRKAVCDDICFAPKAKPEFAEAAEFFNVFRSLTMVGFYTTPEGMKDVGYIGNVPLATFDGPPRELIEKLGLG